MAKWTVQEVSYLINYADYCVKMNLSYEKKATEEFAKKFKRQIYWRKLTKKVASVLRVAFKRQNMTMSEFKTHGTSYIDANDIPAEYLRTMNEQRKKMHLRRLVEHKGKGDSESSSYTINTRSKKIENPSAEAISGPSARPSDIEETPDHASSQETTIVGDEGDARSNAESSKNQHTLDASTSTVVASSTAPTTAPPGPRVKLHLKAPDSISKRKAIESSDGESHPNKHHKHDEHLSNKLGICLEFTAAVLKLHLDNGQRVPDLLLDAVVRKAQQDADFTRESLVATVLREAQSQCAIREKYEAMVTSLVGELEYNKQVEFPKTPSQDEINRAWQAAQQHVLFVAGHSSSTPVLRPGAAGYLSRSVEDIASGCVLEGELDDYVELLDGYLVSPHAHQAFLNALFCRWVFQSPEPMCETHHPPPMMVLYEAQTCVGSLAKIHHLDKLIAQRMYTDPEHHHTIKRRYTTLSDNFTHAASTLCPPPDLPPTTPPIQFASDAIALKHTLMLSPNEYRISFCGPETQFDASWMQAVDAQNFGIRDQDVRGREVALCLFPG